MVLVRSKLAARGLAMSFLISLGACLGGDPQGSSEAALRINPGDSIRVQKGPDMMGLSGNMSELNIFSSTKSSTKIDGRVSLDQDTSSASFKYVRHEEQQFFHIAKVTFVNEGGTAVELAGFLLSNPLSIDLSSNRTVEFFKDILRRDPESREEVLDVLSVFRSASQSTCMTGTAGLSLSSAQRAWSNAFFASGKVEYLATKFNLSFAQKKALAPANLSPYILSGFPFPNPTLASTPVSASENIPGKIETTIFDPDGDVYSSVWSTVDGRPLSAHQSISPVVKRSNLDGVPEVFRSTTSLTFKGGYEVSTPTVSPRFPVRLTLCDGGQAVSYDYDITLYNQNRPPVLVSDMPTSPIEVKVGETKTLSFVFEDPDDDDIDFFSSLTAPEGAVLHKEVLSFDDANKLRGTFHFKEELRNRSNALSEPEVGNPWLEGLTARGFPEGRFNPTQIVFSGDDASITLLKPDGTPETQTVPVHFAYHKDPGSERFQHQQIVFGNETRGLKLYRPFPIENVSLHCHVQRFGSGAYFKMKLACGIGRFPIELSQDGVWIASYTCPSGPVAENNASCNSIKGESLVEGTHIKRIVRLSFRPTRALFQNQKTFSYVVNAIDTPGQATPILIPFKIVDDTSLAPLDPPLRIRKVQLFDSFATKDKAGLFTASDVFLPTTDYATSKTPIDPFDRSIMYSPAYKITNPFERYSEQANTWNEAPGGIKRVRFRGPSWSKRQHWWQHFRWSLETASTSPADAPALSGVRWMRFLNRAPLQKYGKLVLSKPDCNDFSCSLSIDDYSGAVPNTAGANVLEYEVVASEENSFSFRVPTGLYPLENVEAFCEATLHFTRPHLPSPQFAYETDTDKIKILRNYSEPVHSNFELRCGRSLAAARASTSPSLFGPGLDAFLTEPSHKEYLAGSGSADWTVSPGASALWMVADCSYIAPTTDGTANPERKDCRDKDADKSPNGPSWLKSVIDTNYSKENPAGLKFDPPKALAAQDLNGFYSWGSLKIDPVTQRLILPDKLKGQNLSSYRWCRYAFRDQMNTLVLTCRQKLAEGEGYPDLYAFNKINNTSANEFRNTTAFPSHITLHLAYSPLVLNKSSPLSRFYLGSAQEKFSIDLTSPARAPSPQTNLAGIETPMQSLSGSESLTSSNKALLVFKLALDDSYRNIASMETRAARPVVKQGRVFLTNPTTGWAPYTNFPLHIWTPDPDSGDLTLRIPEESERLIKNADTGVSLMAPNEILVVWQAGDVGTYRLELDLEQPTVSLDPDVPLPPKKLTMSMEVSVRAYSPPPYFESFPKTHKNHMWLAQPLSTSKDLGISVFQQPHEMGSQTIYSTVSSEYEQIIVPEAGFSQGSSGGQAQWQFRLEAEKTGNDNPEEKMAIFWLTKYDEDNKRHVLVDPDKDPTWFESIPFIPKTSSELAFKAPKEAFLKTPKSGFYYDETNGGGSHAEHFASFNSSIEYPMKVNPQAPINGILQERELADYLSVTPSTHAKSSEVFRASASTRQNGFDYPENTVVQLYVSKNSDGHPNYQKQLKLRIGDTQSFDVSEPILPPLEKEDDFSSDFDILKARYDSTSKRIVADDSKKVRCRSFLSYSSASINKKPLSTIRWVCLTNETETFGPELYSDTEISSFMKNDPMTAVDLRNHAVIETTAQNSGEFSVAYTPSTESWPAATGSFEKDLGLLTWGQTTGLNKSESIGEMKGILAVYDGKHDIVFSVVHMTAAHGKREGSIPPGDCGTSITRPLSRSSEAPAINCLLRKVAYDHPESFDVAAPVIGLSFRTMPASDDVGKHFVNIDSARTIVDNSAAANPLSSVNYLANASTEHRFDVTSSSTGWAGYSKHSARAKIIAKTELKKLRDSPLLAPRLFKVVANTGLDYPNGSEFQFLKDGNDHKLSIKVGSAGATEFVLSDMQWDIGFDSNTEHPRLFAITQAEFNNSTETIESADAAKKVWCRLYETNDPQRNNTANRTLDVVCNKTGANDFPSSLGAGFDYSKIGTSFEDSESITQDYTNLVAIQSKAIDKNEYHLPRVEWSANDLGYRFMWKLPRFESGTKDARATIAILTGLDYKRLFFAPSIGRRLNFNPKTTRLITRTTLSPGGTYTFPYQYRGERSVEWPLSDTADLALWHYSLGVHLVEENLPPCLASAISAQCLPNSPDELQTALGGGLPDGTSVVSNPSAASGSDTLQNIEIARNKAFLYDNPSLYDDIFEGQTYSFGLSAFDPNLSAGAVQDLIKWEEKTPGGNLSQAVDPVSGSSFSHKSAKIRYLVKDAHINRNNPYSPLVMNFEISDGGTGATNTANAAYTYKLDIWDVNNAPDLSVASTSPYLGTSSLTARNLSFRVTDPDLGDGVSIKFENSTSPHTVVTCNNINVSGSSEADRWTYLQNNALQNGDTLFSIKSNVIEAANSKCGAESLSSSGSGAKTYTVTLKYWDSSRLSSTPSIGFDFSAQDIPWWTTSNTDDKVIAGVPKQYNDLHPKPSLIAPSPLRHVSVAVNLSAPPALRNIAGLLTNDYQSSAPYKVLRLYEGQTLIEPLSFYNPKREPITCSFENENNVPGNINLPYLVYASGEKFQTSSNRPRLYHIDPTNNLGNNYAIAGTNPQQEGRINALKNSLPHVTGCVLYWKPDGPWFKQTFSQGESRTNNIRVRAVVGTTTYYMNYRIGPTSLVQDFIPYDDLSYSLPDVNDRLDAGAFSWTATAGGVPDLIFPAPATTLPNVVIEEGSTASFSLTYKGAPFEITPNQDLGITWYLDEQAVASDVSTFNLSTDSLSSGLRTVSASIRTGTVILEGNNAGGIKTLSSKVFVRNTKAVPYPLSNRSISGIGFAYTSTSPKKAPFSPLHIRTLTSSNTVKSVAVLTSSETADKSGDKIKPWLVSFGASLTTTHKTPFIGKEFAATGSSPAFETKDQNRVLASVISLGSTPSFKILENSCVTGEKTASFWSSSCPQNTFWTSVANSSATGWGYSQRVSTDNKSTIAASYNFRSRTMEAFSWGSISAEYARLDYSTKSLKIGGLSNDSPFQANSISTWNSLTGGLKSDGLPDPNWVLAVTAPDTNPRQLYVIRNPESPEAEEVALPQGFNPAWTWVSQCANCSDPARQRALLVMDHEGKIRWGTLDIETALFIESPVSDSRCQASSCARFSFSEATAPKLNASNWALGHLFPRQYSDNALGNHSFLMIEEGSPNYWTLNLSTGLSERLSIAGARLSTLHCNNTQTAPSSSPGVPINERCYVGDSGNEGVHELR